MAELDIINQRLSLIEKTAEVNYKGINQEFDKVGQSFMKMGELVDIMYIEITVLLDLLAEKKIIDKEEYTKQLETTATKIRDSMLAADKATKEAEVKKL
jgi:Zn finger protein HypA/HybF involved in hydrogenase expression